MLQKWLCKIATQQRNFQGGEPKEWSLFLIERSKRINNHISRVVDFCVDSILGGYITDFGVDTITSYSEAEHNLFQGPCSRYLSSLKTWIKMLVCERVSTNMKSLCINRVAMSQQNPKLRCSQEIVELN